MDRRNFLKMLGITPVAFLSSKEEKSPKVEAIKVGDIVNVKSSALQISPKDFHLYQNGEVVGIQQWRKHTGELVGQARLKFSRGGFEINFNTKDLIKIGENKRDSDLHPNDRVLIPEFCYLDDRGPREDWTVVFERRKGTVISTYYSEENFIDGEPEKRCHYKIMADNDEGRFLDYSRKSLIKIS